MNKTSTFKTLSMATVFALATSFGSSAFAHDISKHDKKTAITKENAQNLVKTLLKKKYSGEGLKARKAKMVGDEWKVSIRKRSRTVAVASVNEKTGDIHIQ